MGFIEEFNNQIKSEGNKKNEELLPWVNNSQENGNIKEKILGMGTKKIASIGLIILVVLVLIVALFNFSKSDNTVSIEKGDNNSANADEQKTLIQVHITGEVINPGVYKLEQGSRIIDGINAAGGFNDKANKNSLNLAKPIEDGEQIIVPSIEEQKSSESSTSASQNNGKVNINTADLTTLQTLSGVGPATAQKIIDYRTANGKFKSIDDLKKVSGIGEKTFEKFKDKICV